MRAAGPPEGQAMSADPIAGLRALAAEWREEAESFRRRGLDREADMAESYAEDLEDRLREWRLELLTLEEAARETGLAYDTVQRKVGSEIPNCGEKGSPRVRRADLHPWLTAPEPRVHGDPVDRLAERTLRGREERG